MFGDKGLEEVSRAADGVLEQLDNDCLLHYRRWEIAGVENQQVVTATLTSQGIEVRTRWDKIGLKVDSEKEAFPMLQDGERWVVGTFQMMLTSYLSCCNNGEVKDLRVGIYSETKLLSTLVMRLGPVNLLTLPAADRFIACDLMLEANWRERRDSQDDNRNEELAAESNVLLALLGGLH